MDTDIKNILDQITDQCVGKIYEDRELQKANIIKYLEKYKFIIGVLSSIVIASTITFVIVTVLMILMQVPLEILL